MWALAAASWYLCTEVFTGCGVALPKTAWGQKRKSVALFDHLVDLRKRRCRHSETERFGSFEIEDQHDFAGCWTGRSSGRPPCFHCMKPSARTFPVVRLAVPTPQICRSLTQA
jgi:hypothetical protein